ncbi:DUF2189 domain-containing protein [Sphingomonas sp. GCM10030256]|uniref:DUF2189 domain-containing protein n=1 Tax=Sphingomonas sp. GCM10030256 TaxID=3273427 RepID=UPI00361B1DAA
MAIAQPRQSAFATSRSEPFEVRRIGNAELRESLAQGWADFMAKRGDLIFIGLIYPLVGFAAAFLFNGGNLFHLLFPVSAGISILGPVVASGFYELARRREDRLESGWSHFLDVRKRPGWDSLVAVAGLLLVIFLVWVTVAAVLWNLLIGVTPTSISHLFSLVFGTPEGWVLIVIGNLFGFACAALVLTLSVVSMPMLVDCDVDARTAVATSVRAVMMNKGPMARWGLIVATLLLLGSIPAFVGLAVVLPVLGYATWHLYVHTVVRESTLCND